MSTNSGNGFQEILVQINADTAYEVRSKALKALAQYRKRNVVTYYSAVAQKPQLGHNGYNLNVCDQDLEGFMNAAYGFDKSIGLDLIVQTYGGGISAAEGIVKYLRTLFQRSDEAPDITVIVPSVAMSAGTMMACAAKEIVLAKHSSLGPFDPFIGGMSTYSVIQQFEQAKTDIQNDRDQALVWSLVMNRYDPGLLIECQNTIKYSNEIVTEWLENGMFFSLAPDVRKERADHVVANWGDAENTLDHGRRYGFNDAVNIGLNAVLLEDDPDLQDLVMAVHHSAMASMTNRRIYKIVESNQDRTWTLMHQ